MQTLPTAKVVPRGVHVPPGAHVVRTRRRRAHLAQHDRNREPRKEPFPDQPPGRQPDELRRPPTVDRRCTMTCDSAGGRRPAPSAHARTPLRRSQAVGDRPCCRRGSPAALPPTGHIRVATAAGARRRRATSTIPLHYAKISGRREEPTDRKPDSQPQTVTRRAPSRRPRSSRAGAAPGHPQQGPRALRPPR